MAITWGSYKNDSSGNGMRLGYEFSQSPSTVGTGTSSVDVTLEIWLQTKFSVVDSTNTFTISGDFSQSGSENINHSGGDTSLLQTEVRTVSTSYTSTVVSDFSSSLTGINAIPGTCSVSGSWTTSKRPLSPPFAPDNIAASRNSDTSHTITWVKDPGTTAGNPYQNVEVQRWDNIGGSYNTIATLSGSATSYTNTSTRVDRQYRWRVRATNSAGDSGWVYTGYWSTTPDPPSNVIASKISNDIKIDWTNHASAGTGIEVWHATNGTWDGSAVAVLSGSAPNQPTSYTHINPNASQTHQYRLKCQAGTTDDAPTTYSAYSSASNVIQLLTNPAAPTGLSPTSGTVDAVATAMIFTWQHNEVDGTSQTKYDFQYRLDGGSWVLSTTTSSVQSKTIAAATLTNGHQLEWQVRTYGAYATAPAYSPWSAIGTMTLSAAPQAGLTYPDGITDVATSRVTPIWTYYDEEGTAQAAFRVKLYTAAGAVLLEDRSGSGDATTYAMTTLLSSGVSYRLGVLVQDGSGLWSPEFTQDFTVTFALPPVPLVDLTWDPDGAAVQVSINNPVNVGDPAVADHNEVWRSLDGITYEKIADDVPVNSTVTDYIPAAGVENTYMVIAITDIGASTSSLPGLFTTPTTAGWFWFNGGEAFSQLVKLYYSPARNRTFSRAKTLNSYAGREFPVETAGESRTRDFDMTFSAFGEDDATLQQIEDLADLAAPICVRGPSGERRYVSLQSTSASSSGSYEAVSLKMTEVSPPQIDTMPV